MGFKMVATLSSILILVFGYLNHEANGSWQNGAGHIGDVSSIAAARSSPAGYGATGFNPTKTSSVYWDGGKPHFSSARVRGTSIQAQYLRGQRRSQNAVSNGWTSSPYLGNGLGKSQSIYNMNWGDNDSSSSLRSSSLSSNRDSTVWGDSGSTHSGWERTNLRSSSPGWRDSSRSLNSGAVRSSGWDPIHSRSSNGNGLTRNSWNNNNVGSYGWPYKTDYNSDSQW